MRSKTTRRWMFAISGAMVAAIVLGAGAFTLLHVTTSHASPGYYTPRVYTLHHNLGAAQIGSTTTSLPHWTSSFTYKGTTYSYTMVGTNPASGSVTTTIPVTIIPLDVTFSSGHPLNGALKVANTVASPLFKSATYATGDTTQYGDAMFRAEFWSAVQSKSPKYHVLLGTPTIAATQNITVPAADGVEGKTSGGNTIGEAEINWWDPQIQALIAKLRFTPNTLPIFLTYNVFLYQGTSSNCCIIGYHSAEAVSGGVQTYAWASNNDGGVFPPADHIADINALSHEIAEWYNDPYANNTVPSWTVPSEPQYGCSSLLEVGDPLVGKAFYLNGYHPQDVAFFSWFARQSPSTGWAKHYTYLGIFKTYSPSC